MRSLVARPDKESFIKSYFDKWDRDAHRAAELLSGGKFLLEGILTLSCYLGALAALRFPEASDSEAYPRFVLDYSGKREFYAQVDLLFFLQWPRSKLRNHGHYKQLKGYAEVAEALKKKFGSEDDVKAATRYVSQGDVVALALAAKIPNLDEGNLRDKLPLFSLAQILSRYLRCDAVHNADFPLLNESVDTQGHVTYKPNHVITSDVLLETVRAALQNLREECLRNSKWPQELSATAPHTADAGP